ncbi:hypothetical protein SeLEV6574_g07562 [Synchytrium endobioticum]|uniref:Retrovirus-related Pol polyprotein from transposon TNT 1-94-like beta-barrel domain-containing protein n=1 Tax=Synchytrium endobioticum TaxID=286115 RepID=A0A507CKE3_9FUNG|nr:hypothetical protein SeLEV6574_g07562 [Synchytrium endobioticum]
MEALYTKKLEVFDPKDPDCVYNDWKQAIIMGMGTIPDLDIHVMESSPKMDPKYSDETTAQYNQKISKFKANIKAAAVYVRDRVTKDVKDRLAFDWTAHKMMEYLDANYGMTIGISLLTVWDDVYQTSLSDGDDPVFVCTKIEKAKAKMEIILKAKNITTVEQVLSVMSTLILLWVANVEPYKNMVERIVSKDDITTIRVDDIRNQMVNVKSFNDTSLSSPGQIEYAMQATAATHRSPTNRNLNDRNMVSNKVQLCTRCWQVGHRNEKCTNTKVPLGYSGLTGKERNQYWGQICPRICFKCWMPGHNMLKCYNKSRPFPGINASEANTAVEVSLKEETSKASTYDANPSVSTSHDPVWLVDSGANAHMTGRADIVDDLVRSTDVVYGIGNTRMDVIVKGRVKGYANGMMIVLQDVLLVKGLNRSAA